MLPQLKKVTNSWLFVACAFLTVFVGEEDASGAIKRTKLGPLPPDCTYTTAQKHYLQAVMDKLWEMERPSLAEKLNQSVREGKVKFGECGPGTQATAHAPWGYFGGSKGNLLTIDNDGADDWYRAKEIAKRAGTLKGGDPRGIAKKQLSIANECLNEIALTLEHEYIHMDQRAPQEIPEHEDPAWAHGIRQTRRVIDLRMKQIKACKPGEEKIRDQLLDDLKSLIGVYTTTVTSLTKKGGKIDQGVVTAAKFTNALRDKDKKVKEVGAFISSFAAAGQAGPSAGAGRPGAGQAPGTPLPGAAGAGAQGAGTPLSGAGQGPIQAQPTLQASGSIQTQQTPQAAGAIQAQPTPVAAPTP